MSAPAMEISVYDKNRNFVCPIGNPLIAVATPRHNLISTASVSVALGHERIGALTADGARMKIKFRGNHLISGPIDNIEGEGSRATGKLSFTIKDDMQCLWEILGWPVPGAAISAQNTAENYSSAGDAETIFKDIVKKNGLDRLGYPGLVIGTNLHRGAVIDGGVQMRMDMLADKLFPALDQAGIGVTVKQVGNQLVLDVYTPRVFGTTLSEAGGSLKGWKWNRTRPKATRAIIGGPGDGAQRIYRQVIDAPREAQYGTRQEIFVDASSAESAAIMDAQGWAALKESGQTNGLSLDLAEAGRFMYGANGVQVGDQVTVDIGGGVKVTDVLREATLTWVAGPYASVVPTLGERKDQPDRVIAKSIAALSKGLRLVKASR